jgi:hypothetical protein
VLLSPRLATAIPDGSVQQIALRICSLYLQQEIELDEVCLDRIYLEQPGSRRTTWEWVTGVNYFSAQGDRRWWQDHRIPAGMAFSINSVGHMVKAGKLARVMRDLEEAMETAPEEFTNPNVDSLDKALELAMRTIALASDGPSGKATMLVPLPEDTSDLPKCPIKLPASLAGKNYCEYRGFYHTDYTVPSEYFFPAVDRPMSTRTHELDFSYLFDTAFDNPDFDRVGIGRMIRESSAQPEHTNYKSEKRLRGSETEVEIDDIPRLRHALDQ